MPRRAYRRFCGASSDERLSRCALAHRHYHSDDPRGWPSLFFLLWVHASALLKFPLTLRKQNFARAGRITIKENPMPNLEETIRERAYHLWIADGQPEGKAEIYWLNAQREILTTSVESSAGAAATVDVATKPARRVGGVRSGKSKTRAA